MNPGGWGFGAPDALPGAVPIDGFFDWGFGDPVPDAWAAVPADWAFGDVPPDGLTPVIVPIKATQLYPDDGGEVILLQGDWSAALPDAGVFGPYRVQLVDAFTGALYPPTTQALGAHSARIGKGIACETDKAKRRLLFALPTSPPGVYDVKVSYGPNFATTITIVKALRVVRRNRAPEDWALRRALPPAWTAGPRMAETEPRLGA